jgi:hypothetical protein
VDTQAGSAMLDKYLADPATITEKISVLPPPEKVAEVVDDKANKMKETLSQWQASWEKK